jgi:hypothetical protein
MATVPLILRGNLKIGADSGSAVDVSDAVTKFRIAAQANEVQIPATLSTDATSRKGGVKYTIDIDYLANDEAATELFRVFWAAVTQNGEGELYFEGSFRDGAVSAANPKWSGNFVVLSAALGGDADGLATDSSTFPLLAAPAMATS